MIATHAGPTEVLNGTATRGAVGEAMLKVSSPLRVINIVGTGPGGATRTTTTHDSKGCSSFSTTGPPTIEYALALPAERSRPVM